MDRQKNKKNLVQAAVIDAKIEEKSCGICKCVEVSGSFLECRRFPPHLTRPGAAINSFPIVRENYYCHEYQKK